MNTEHTQDTFTSEFFENIMKDFPIEFQNIGNLSDISIFIEKHFSLLETLENREEIENLAKKCYLQEKPEIIRYFIDNCILSFSEVALERIRLFLSSLGLEVEGYNLSDGCIDFPTMQNALDFWRITDSSELENYGSWEELSNNHILFMF